MKNEIHPILSHQFATRGYAYMCILFNTENVVVGDAK